ncbi:Superkiller protein 3 [Massospora cicadina]|nr:Superkiller protein 3 [Massospora cicadina]
MSSKDQLKRAKDHIARKEFDLARDLCRRVLMFDSGLAQQNLGLTEEAEATYKKAISLSPEQPAAYQGLISLYEKTDQVDVLPQAYADARKVFMERGSASKVVELTNKLIEFYALDPVYLELRLETMRSLLPGGDMYPFVEKSGLSQAPLPLLTAMADLEYARDQRQFISEVESRRRRLSNDTMDTIRRKVKTEIHQQSQYLSTLEMILAIKDLDQNARLKSSESYLAYLLERLLYTFIEDKQEALSKLLAHSSSLFSEGLGFDLAYEVHYGFQDVGHSDYKLEQFVRLHPTSKLATLARHILDNNSQAFVMEDLETSSISLIAHHALAWHFQRLNQTDLALAHAKSLDAFTKGFPNAVFPRVKRSCRLVVAFCYLKLEPSLQNVAYNTLQSVLESDPHNLLALEGVTQYAMAKGHLELAKSTLATALELEPANPNLLLSLGWTRILNGTPSEAIAPIQEALALTPNSAVGLFRLGRAYWDLGGSFREDKRYAYAYFLKAAQADSTLGDPFLFLGHFYCDVANDKARALKCYFKATQLKQGIEAYQALYAQQVEAGDVLGAQKSLQLAAQEFSTLAWPWGKLGLLHLTNSSWNDAIACFQSALKVDFERVEYWEGLGEAYLEAGRYLAALKAFQRAETLSPNVNVAYHTAKVHLQLGNHQAASLQLETVVKSLAPDSIYFAPCLKLLAQVFYCHSQVAHRSGAFGLMARLAEKSLGTLEWLLNHDSGIYSGWELLGDLALLSRLAPHQFSNLNLAVVSQLLVSKAQDLNQPQLADELQALDVTDSCTALLHMAAICYQLILYGLRRDELMGHLLYKTAFALHAAYSRSHSAETLSKGLACIRSALSFEPSNALFWELLGTMTVVTRPDVSQHAVCQSILLDGRNPSPYANYGYLCLLHSDYELAAQAFSRAQTLSPEFAPAWIGQAIVAQATSAPNALEVIAHAFTLNESISRGLNLAYAACLFKGALPQPLPRSHLHSGIFALQKLVELAPDHAQALNLLAAYYEQADSLEAAVESLTAAKDSLVAEHTANQDPTALPTTLAQFVRVMLNLGRVLIALRRFEEAGAAYQAAEGCVDQLHGPISERDAVHLQLGSGVARFYLQDLQPALACFERAVQLSAAFPTLHHQVTLQVSQVLWAMGSGESQAVAKEQLMGYIHEPTQTVGVLLTLLSMGLIQGDTDLAAAAVGKLQSVLPHVQDREDSEMMMQYVLAQLDALQRDYSSAIGSLMSSLLRHPSMAAPYLRLAHLSLQLREVFPAATKMVRQVTASGLAIAITGPNALPATAPSELVARLYMAQASAAYLGSKTANPSSDVQRAIFAAPWLYSLI